jgi:hypothetical protein
VIRTAAPGTTPVEARPLRPGTSHGATPMNLFRAVLLVVGLSLALGTAACGPETEDSTQE